MAHNELDTNADTCCLGTNFVVISYTTRTADVYAYDTSIKPKENIPIVTGATAYDDPVTGETFILIVNEGLYYGTRLDHSLINPNQIRSYGIPVWDNPYDNMHGLSIDVSEDFIINLTTKGTKIFFQSRSPTRNELEDEKAHITLTDLQAWNPERVRLGISETTQNSSDVLEITSDPRGNLFALYNIEPSLVFLKERMISKVAGVMNKEFGSLPKRNTLISTERHEKTTANHLSEKFGIGLQRAYATLQVTLQQGKRSAILPISRRYRADRFYNVKRLNGRFSTDTIYGNCVSLRGNIASQVYSHKCGFAKLYHLTKTKGDDIGETLANFIHEYGAPEHLTFDGAAVQVGSNTKFNSLLRQHHINYHISAPRRPNENPAEGAIREIKKRAYRMMFKLNVPNRLWDYLLDWICETANICANSSKYSDARTPLEIITGETPDISEYLDFGFYDWVTFRSNAGLGKIELGRWLGVSHRIGQLMSYWILPKSGRPVSCVTVQHVTYLEQQTDEFKIRMNDYTKGLEAKLKAKSAQLDLKPEENVNVFDLNKEDQLFIDEYNRVIDNKLIKHEDEISPYEDLESDKYLHATLGLRRHGGTEIEYGRVKRRAVDLEGKPIGVSNKNPLLDSRLYEIEFGDGEVDTMTANIIAENLFCQIDDEGKKHLMIEEIIDHRVDNTAIPLGKGTYKSKYGATFEKRTTRGWEICVSWKDGSTDWVSLKDMKNSYPIELAEYAVQANIIDEPAFKWWVKDVLRKRSRIVSKVKSKYWNRTHKYGIRIPKNIKEAKEIDLENGDSLWMEAVQSEMKSILSALKLYEGDTTKLIGYQQITGHLVFDIKLGENFRRKARYCADGHKTGVPTAMTYSSVVARDSVRIMLLIAGLNGLNVKSADVKNAFLTAPNKEKCWLIAGPEFGALEGNIYIVEKALYGLKSASASFRSFLADILDDMGFRSTHADPDVWRRPAIKGNGEKYYEYFLTYVDDLLAISMDPNSIIHEIQRHVKLKNDAIEEPSNYLGAQLTRKFINGINIWTMSSVNYVKAAIKNIESMCMNRGIKLPVSAETPMQLNYVPELDSTPELKPDDITWYQELIGILRWATEIGRVDVLLEVSLLSQFQASPREGHLQQLLRIFTYLKRSPKLTLYFDSNLPNVDYSRFKSKPEDFKEIYRDAYEDMPFDYVEPRGRPVVITVFADASFAQNKINRRSHSGHIVFLNRSPIIWYSKRQSTVESSTFSSEFIALKVAVETTQFLRFKLRSFGIPILNNDPAYVFCDNQSVVNNSTLVESKMLKKHSSVAFHLVRNAVAAGSISIAWIESGENLADVFTKRLNRAVREYLFGNFVY